MMKVFLDIDGVMVHANPYKKVDMEEDGFYKFNKNAVDAINSIDYNEIEIILSTSHRFRFNIQAWKLS
ncbi:HAD domain-containing protein, partial [Chryseobacterium joostei]|uniref:HAD domain-containing protein n=1 Tax=Chryseobacterium joostei TaxID=112234 RepID=UPI0023F1873F